MEWNNTSPDERIRLWKNFRSSIRETSEIEQATATAMFFFQVPIQYKPTIDFYTPSSWPTPWEILYGDNWCKNTISILMYHTFEMIGTPVELVLIDDTNDRYLVPRLNTQIVLNYELGKISKIHDIVPEIRIIEVHTSNTLKNIK